MNFFKRLRLYLSGVFLGLIFLLFMYGDKVFSWSYLPNDRVLAEIKLKKISFSPQSESYLIENNLTTSFILDTVLVKGSINFNESNAQNKPCPYYTLYHHNIKVNFTKCKDSVFINSLNHK